MFGGPYNVTVNTVMVSSQFYFIIMGSPNKQKSFLLTELRVCENIINDNKVREQHNTAIAVRQHFICWRCTAMYDCVF